MTYHILNGDALKDHFPQQIKGTIIVARECLIDGKVQSSTMNEFWHARAAFIEKTYGASSSEYEQKVRSEFEKISTIENGDVINLWFEDDLFCQVNLWFVASEIKRWHHQNACHLVRPLTKNWKGFGPLSSDELITLYDNRTALTEQHITHLSQMWHAYQNHDLVQLQSTAQLLQKITPFVDEAVKAHKERFPQGNQRGRPEQTLLDIKNDLHTSDFGIVFKEFQKREGVYGFGDLQLQTMWNKVKNM